MELIKMLFNYFSRLLLFIIIFNLTMTLNASVNICGSLFLEDLNFGPEQEILSYQDTRLENEKDKIRNLSVRLFGKIYRTNSLKVEKTISNLISEHIINKMNSLDESTLDRFQRVISVHGLKIMNITDLGKVDHSNILRRTNLTLNALTVDSPLYALTMASELEIVSRSILINGRIERFLNYQFVSKEESSAATVEFNILKSLLQRQSYDEISSELLHKRIDGRSVSENNLIWQKNGWIDSDARITASGLELIMNLLKLNNLQTAQFLKKNSDLRNFLTNYYDQIFLEKLHLVNTSSIDGYIKSHLEAHKASNQAHQMMLSVLHSNALFALILSLSDWWENNAD